MTASSTDTTLRTELRAAVQDGRADRLLQLLEAGANLNELSRLGTHVLHTAVSRFHPDVFQLLLDHGVDVDVRNKFGETPLHIVCDGQRVKGRKIIMRQLLLHGANIDAKNMLYQELYIGGETPLHKAVAHSSIIAVNLLLAHGADMSIQEGEGYNALHWALWYHKREVKYERHLNRLFPMLPTNPRKIEKAKKVIQILLTHGTDVYAKIANLRATTVDDDTPEDLAYSVDIGDMLRSALLLAERERRDLLLAFAMGQHKRLGAVSHVRNLPTEVVKMIVDRVY
jgi:hypothetical protein